jgi:hypothetical protein
MVGLLAILGSSPVSGQDQNAENLAKVIESIAVPELPALSVLGVTPDKVTRPGNGRELALAILQGIDENGNPQNGLAIDLAPYLLFFGNDISHSHYRENWLCRFASHIQLSLGTAKGQGENDKSIRMAAGLRASIFDSGDPRRDTALDSCIGKAQDRVLNKHRRPIPPDASAEAIADSAKTIEKETEAEVQKCREKHSRESSSKPALDIGFSPLWISEDGQTKNLKFGGIAAWSSFKAGIGGFLAVASVQYKSRDRKLDPEGTEALVEGSSLSGGIKARYGNASSGFLTQVVYTSFDQQGRNRDDQVLYSIGGEIAVAKNLWLETVIGSTGGKEGNGSAFVSSQFKWGLSEKSVLTSH